MGRKGIRGGRRAIGAVARALRRRHAGSPAARVPATKLVWKFHETLLPFFWQDLPHKTAEHANLVREGYGVWADDFSRREYVAQIAWRLAGDIEGLAPPVAGESYFPTGLVSLRPN